MSSKVDARVGRRMEKVILRAVACHGAIHYGSSAYIEITVNLFKEQPLDSGVIGDSPNSNRMNSLVVGLVNDGLLSPPEYSQHKGTSQGLTVKGWKRLDQLKHPVRTWLARHGWSAAIAGAAVLSSVVASVTLIITAIV